MNKDKIYKETMRRIKANNKKTNRKKRPVKRTFLIAAIITVIAAVSAMNVTAFRTFLYKTFVRIEGDILKISANYTEFDGRYKGITNFENKDEMIVPGWLPNETQLVKVEDNKDSIRFKYIIDDRYLELTEVKINFEDNSSSVELENNLYDSKSFKVLGTEGTIVEREFESGIKQYIAMFATNSVNYTIISSLSENDLLIILENLKYFEKF